MKSHSFRLSGVSLAALTLSAVAPTHAWAQYVLPEVEVIAEPPADPNQITIDLNDPTIPPAVDAGELLRSVPGISAGRMGGHGVDPVIRGQKSNQLNIINDGAFTFGGCPNRMDPPTSTIAPETMDRVTVTKGYQSVTNGPGATGGTIRFDRDPPKVTADKPYAVKAGGGYDSNGATRDGWLQATGGTEAGYVRGGGNWKSGENYKDGNDQKVRAAFSQFGGGLEAGWTPRDTLLSLGYQYNKAEDVLFAGAGMDAPLDETDTIRLKFETRRLATGALDTVRFNAYASLLDHVMDNYSLRVPASAATRRNVVDADSDTYGGQFAADWLVGDTKLTTGMDVQVNNRDARRYSRVGSAVDLESDAYLESVTWPDVTIGQYGLFGEGTIPFQSARRLKLGARYDHVAVDYGAADQTTRQNTGTYNTANDLYSAYYGKRAGDQTENNLGGLIRFEQDVGGTTLFAGLSRAVRTADATERGIAHKPLGTNKAWVGNPNIDPEAHHQLDLGATTQARDWSLNGSVYYDRVQDFILRDSARGQSGILKSDNATIYRNVAAHMAGLDIGGQYRVATNWTIATDIAYTYAKNLDDDSAIAQIPPLSGSLSVSYAPEGWSLGSRMRWAATQTRVDSDVTTGSGQDTGETSGYAVFDLYGSYTVTEGFVLDAGVTNLLDHTYAEHLNRSSSFDNTVTQVNEAGRSFYLRTRVAF